MKKYAKFLEFFFITLFLVLPPILFQTPNSKEITFKFSLFSELSLIIALIIFFRFEYSQNTKVKKNLLYFLLQLAQIIKYFGLLILTVCLLSGFAFLLKIDANKEVFVNVDKSFFYLLLVFVDFAFRAFYEEAIYRLYLPKSMYLFFNFLKEKYFLQKDKVFIERYQTFTKIIIEVSCIIIFSLGHLYLGIIPFINSIFAGIILRHCAIKNKTILLGTISHLIYNCLIFVIKVL